MFRGVIAFVLYHSRLVETNGWEYFLIALRTSNLYHKNISSYISQDMALAIALAEAFDSDFFDLSPKQNLHEK